MSGRSSCTNWCFRHPDSSFVCFIRIAFCVAIRISGLEISFQELVEVIFYKSDIGRILTEIICVCGVVNFGSMTDVMVKPICVTYFFQWFYLCEKVQGNDYAQSA